jgi:PD-(D/E)XK nuclease superfamily
MQDSGVKAVQFWHRVVAPTVHPAYVEQHIQFKLNGIVIDGTIDEVDADGLIRDHKFVGKKPSSGEQYVLNMTGYAIGYRQLTGKVERGIVLDHVVRTKEPQHVAIPSDPDKIRPVPDQDIVAYADIIDTVSRSIEAGLFPPTGLKSHACSWCGFAKSGDCRYYRRS